jgi:hypothetical protein
MPFSQALAFARNSTAASARVEQHHSAIRSIARSCYRAAIPAVRELAALADAKLRIDGAELKNFSRREIEFVFEGRQEFLRVAARHQRTHSDESTGQTAVGAKRFFEGKEFSQRSPDPGEDAAQRRSEALHGLRALQLLSRIRARDPGAHARIPCGPSELLVFGTCPNTRTFSRHQSCWQPSPRHLKFCADYERCNCFRGFRAG